MSSPTCKEAMLLQVLVGFLITKIVGGLYDSLTSKLKRSAVGQISNQFVLTYFAQHDADAWVRSESVKKIIAPTTLKHILAKETDSTVRLAILSRLAVTDAADEYLRSKDRSYKKQLLGLIVTQNELCRIAAAETDWSLLKLILPKITNPDHARKLRAHTLLEVRNWVDSQPWATKTNVNHRDPVLSVLAADNPSQTLLSRIRAPRSWYKIAMAHTNLEIQLLALANLSSRKDLLARIATNNSLTVIVRMQALRLMGPDQLVATLARSDPSVEMRVQATAMLDPLANAPVLTSIMKYEKKTDVLIQAIMTTSTPSDLALLRQRLDPQKSPHIIAILNRRRQILSPKS